MHGIRRSLLVAQAESIGIPLRELYLPEDTTLETYGRLMGESWNEFKKGGTNSAVFGDIFLEDLRKYREEQLQKAGIEAVFPLWKIDTEKLAKQFIEYGFRSIVTCVDGQKLDRSFAGRLYDRSFLEDLPADVDPCGEIGEFHSFVFDGPIFEKPVDYSVGEIVHKNYKAATGEVHNDKGFWFAELIPGVET